MEGELLSAPQEAQRRGCGHLASHPGSTLTPCKQLPLSCLQSPLRSRGTHASGMTYIENRPRAQACRGWEQTSDHLGGDFWRHRYRGKVILKGMSS